MGITSIVLTPINLLISGLFPDLGSYFSGVATLLANLANGIAFVGSQLPPMFKSLVIASLSVLIFYYQMYWSYTIISKAWSLIQRVKFW